MTTNQILCRLASLAFISALPQVLTPAVAQELILPGTARPENIVEAGDLFRAYFDLNRSYACTLQGTSPTTELGLSPSIINPSGNPIQAIFRGAATPPVTTGNAADTNRSNNRAAVFATVAGEYTFTIATARSGGESARFECDETTLYGNYNTVINQIHFLELTNIANESVKVIWIARNSDGSTVSEEITIPSERRIDVDLHSRIGTSSFGHLKVKHDGPFGAISASISQYEVAASNFTLRATVPLKPRDSVSR